MADEPWLSRDEIEQAEHMWNGRMERIACYRSQPIIVMDDGSAVLMPIGQFETMSWYASVNEAMQMIDSEKRRPHLCLGIRVR